MWEQVLGAFSLTALMWPNRFHLCTTSQENVLLCWRSSSEDSWRILLHLAEDSSGTRPPEHVMVAFGQRRNCSEGGTCEPLDRSVAEALRALVGGQYFAVDAPGLPNVIAQTISWALANSGGFAPP